MATIQYVEINVIGMAILLMMLLFQRQTRSDTHKRGQREFRHMLIANILILLADTALTLFDGNPSLTVRVWDHFSCTLYYLLHAYFSREWLLYTYGTLYPDVRPSRKWMLGFSIPMLLATLIVLSSPWTGWIYTLGPNCEYARGPMLWTIIVLSYGYWVVSLTMVVGELLHPTRIREHSVCWSLLVFPLPTLVGNIAQMLCYGVSLMWICSALSLLILFIVHQNNRLSRDMLTGLFNRSQTDQQLSWELAHLHDAKDRLCVIMIDVDRFKSINDRFGHVQGDRALMAVAAILKRGCRQRDFVGRFGGDEFIVIGHVADASGAEAVLEAINRECEAFNHTGAEPFVIGLSMGYALYSAQDVLSVDHVISRADQAMYQVKSQRRTARVEA